MARDASKKPSKYACTHKETGNAEYIYLRGIVHAQQQNFTEAIKLCEEASQQLPDRADIAYNFGVICYSANDLKRAVTAWQHTVEIDKTHDDANFNLALGLDQLGQEKEAQKTYEMLLTVNPKHELALYNLANLKTRLNESEKALPLYNRLLALKPDFEAGWINYGMAAQRAGTLKEAEDHFKKAIALNPQSVDAHWNLSHLLLIQGHWQEGFAEYEWRLQRAEAPKPEWPQPVWDGSKIKINTCCFGSIKVSVMRSNSFATCNSPPSESKASRYVANNPLYSLPKPCRASIK